jgi:hypothetical protein
MKRNQTSCGTDRTARRSAATRHLHDAADALTAALAPDALGSPSPDESITDLIYQARQRIEQARALLQVELQKPTQTLRTK